MRLNQLCGSPIDLFCNSIQVTIVYVLQPDMLDRLLSSFDLQQVNYPSLSFLIYKLRMII